MAIQRKKKKSYFLQARLHEDVEGELDPIELCQHLSENGWTDREISAAALRSLVREMDNGKQPEQTITAVKVDEKMMGLFDALQSALTAYSTLAENLNNGAWSKKETIQHVNGVIEKLGIPLNASRHVASIHELDESEEW